MAIKTGKQSAQKDITVVQTDHYVVIKIPRHRSKTLRAKKEYFADIAGVLNDVAAFKGKSSVEVQHLIKTLWHGHGKDR